MDDLMSIMQEILKELRETNNHLSSISGCGINSMDEICSSINALELEAINLNGNMGQVISSMNYMCSRIESLELEVNSIKGNTGYDLTDIHKSLSNIEINTL